MDTKTKDELKTFALLATGTLTEFALLKSMARSKTLTLMVIFGVISFTSFVLILINMAGA